MIAERAGLTIQEVRDMDPEDYQGWLEYMRIDAEEKNRQAEEARSKAGAGKGMGRKFGR